jgi:hypothetical protein
MNGLLAKLGRVNRTTVFLVALAVMLIALFTPGVLGGILLLVLAAGLGVLLRHTWAGLPAGHRVLRVASIAVLVLVAVTKIT